MDEHGGIAKQQQEELRLLSERYRNGQVNDAQYKHQREQILARAQSLMATSRGADGLVSTKALVVDTSYGPLLVKSGIAVVILAVCAQVGWIVIKQYVIDYRPTLEEKIPAIVETMPAAPGNAAAPPAAPSSEQPVMAGAALAPDEPQSAAAISTGLSAETSTDAPSPTLSEPAAADASQSPTPSPDEPNSPIAMTQSITAAGETSLIPPPPSPPQIATEPAEPMLTWQEDLPKMTVDEKHPFKKWCELVRHMSRGQMSAQAGVTVGPEAADLNDPVYQQFRDQRRVDFEQTVLQADDTLKVVTLNHPVRSGNVLVERTTTNNPRTRSVAMLVTTVHDGRAYAYYFEGDNGLLVQFNVAVGTATYGPPASLPTPTDAASTPSAGW
ncbi:MAG: hypothetical protein IT445_21225 [Phycisphaeraceae bacterium]|nr:hypothetical protein [Phycisphaeraceae bacterium]